MATQAIRIRVGASLDASASNAFKPVVAAARAARQAIEDEMARAWEAIRGEGAAKGGGKGGPYRAMVREAERAADKIIDTEKRKQRQLEQEEKRAIRRREAAERHVARIRERYFREQQREYERGEAKKLRDAEAARKERVSRGRAILSGTGETLKGVGRGALGITGSVARGAGVQTDLASFVAQAVEVETRATELSSAAYDEQRDKGKRLDPKDLVRLGRQVGQEAAFDPARVLEGLQAFVGKTGDLATGQAALPGLAKLARATGTSLEDMVGAAGEAAKALGEVGPGKDFETAADKGKALVNVLRLIAGQGKVGAVELKDLAQYGGRLAAASQAFGGDAAQNLGDMGALAQLAVARGGAASAAEAATAVAGFANTLKTPARAKEFAGKGVKLEDEKGGFRSVRDILKESAAAAVARTPEGGSASLEFKKMFANVKGAQAADPAFLAYRKAFAENLAVTKDKTKADKAGKDAIDALFDQFGKAISAEEEAGSFGKAMDTTAAKVQLFNNQLAKIGADMAARVLPQLQKLAPTIVSVAESFAKIVEFAAENPGMAIVAAITASIGKAAIGTVVSSAVGKLIEGAAAKMSGRMALALGAASIAIATATIAAQYLNEKKKTGAEAAKTEVGDAEKALSAAEKEFKEKGTISAENMQAIENARRHVVEAEMDAKEFQARGGKARYFGEGGLAGEIAGGARQAFDVATGATTFEEIGKQSELSDRMRDLSLIRQGIDGLKQAIDAQGKKTQKVEVTNMPPPTGAPGPQANVTNTTK